MYLKIDTIKFKKEKKKFFFILTLLQIEIQSVGIDEKHSVIIVPFIGSN